MPVARIPLVGSFTQRGLAANATLDAAMDQRFLNCTFCFIRNPITGKSSVHVEKRPGFGVDSIVSANNPSTGLIRPQAFNATITAFGDTNSTIYFGTSSVGTITGRAMHFTETLISGVSYVVIRSSDGTAWYYANGAKDVTAYTCDTNGTTTISDIKVGGVNSVSGLYVGQMLTGTDFAAGTRIVSINSGAFTAVISAAATGTTNDLATTKEPIAKIIDADFVTTGTKISGFVEMDGFLFYATDDGYIRNSDINSVTSFTAANAIAVQMSPDPMVALWRHRNMIVAFGGASKEVFYNAGLQSGSPLTRAAQYFDRVGCQDQLAVCGIENEVYFVSTPYEGDVGVFKIVDMRAERISTPVVDKIIGTAVSTGGTIYASAFRLGGYKYASFFISNASEGAASELLMESGDDLLLESGDNILLDTNASQIASYVRTLTLNVDLNLWSEWDCPEATFIRGTGIGQTNQIIATSRVKTGGKVYSINPSSSGQLYQDDGESLTMEIRTGKLDFGSSNRIFVKSVSLICDKASSGTVTLEANDNDFDSDDWFTLGTFDLTNDRKRIYRCGSHAHGRSYRLTHSDNAFFRAEAIDIDYEVASQ